MLGTKLSFVLDVVCGKFPVVALTMVGYQVALELVLSVIAVFVAFVADPTDNVDCATYWGAVPLDVKT